MRMSFVPSVCAGGSLSSPWAGACAVGTNSAAVSRRAGRGLRGSGAEHVLSVRRPVICSPCVPFEVCALQNDGVFAKNYRSRPCHLRALRTVI